MAHRPQPASRPPLLRFALALSLLLASLACAHGAGEVPPPAVDPIPPVIPQVTPAAAVALPAATPAPPTIDLDQIGGGELLGKGADGLFPLPMLHSDAQIEVDGIMAHGRLSQRFSNPSPDVIEAVYVFPLPENAAVHHMEIVVGERRIVSVIQEKREARETYTQARDSGRKAALVEQERPNLFTSSVANIEPGQTIEVVLEYIHEVDYDDGRFSLHFPLTFTPRFVPEVRLQMSEATGELSVVSAIVEDANRITPPFQKPYEPTAPTAQFRARIRPGFEPRDLRCSSHSMRVNEDDGLWTLEPQAQWIAADRDVKLEWRARDTERASSAFLSELRGDEEFGLLMLVPPAPNVQDAQLGLPTETLFVIDVSGSMDGPSIRQARHALLSAIDRLQPGDRFNVLRFNNRHSFFRVGFVDGDGTEMSAARNWVRALRADGGTMIYPALLAAISSFSSGDENVGVQRIVFLTDGAVGNEDQMIERVAAGLGRIRLHTIGIGPAPNRHLMQRLAEAGRGLCDFVSHFEEADDEIDRFFQRLERPVLSELELEWTGAQPTEIHPARLPDLHDGEPLILSARFGDGPPRGLRLRGISAAGPFDREIDLGMPSEESAGISTRWARAKIASLMQSMHMGADEALVKLAVIDVGREFHLVTSYTSLVAVEEFASVDEAGRQVRVANALPQGSTLLDGSLPSGGTLDVLKLWLALTSLGAGVVLSWLARRS